VCVCVCVIFSSGEGGGLTPCTSVPCDNSFSENVCHRVTEVSFIHALSSPQISCDCAIEHERVV
jgi:hypothetical protein